MRHLSDEKVVGRAREVIETISGLLASIESVDEPWQRVDNLALLERIVSATDHAVAKVRQVLRKPRVDPINWSQIRFFYQMVVRSGFAANEYPEEEPRTGKQIRTNNWMARWKQFFRTSPASPRNIEAFLKKFPMAAVVAEMLRFEWTPSRVVAFKGMASNRWLIARISDRLRADGYKGVGARNVAGKLVGKTKSH